LKGRYAYFYLTSFFNATPLGYVATHFQGVNFAILGRGGGGDFFEKQVKKMKKNPVPKKNSRE
jgi:hypothetical protein